MGIGDVELPPATLNSEMGVWPRYRIGISWNLLAAVSSQGATFVASIMLARMLGRQAYGEYAIVQSTVLTAVTFAQLGTGLTATKYVAEFRARDKRRAGNILGLCLTTSVLTALALGLALAVFAHPLASSLLRAPTLAPKLYIGAGIIVFAAVNGTQIGALAGLEAYRSIARVSVLNACLSICGMWIGARTFGVSGALIGFLVANSLQCALYWQALRRELSAQGIQISVAELGTERPVLHRFALPAAASGLISMPALWLAAAILVRQSNGLVEMALYGAAATTKGLVLFVPNIVNNVASSLLNNHRDQPSAYRRIFWRNLATVSAAALLAAATIALLAPLILSVFGASFRDSTSVLRILLLAGVLESTAGALYLIIQAEERMTFSLFFIAIPRDSIIVLSAWYFVPAYGALGLAYSVLTGWGVAIFIYMIGAYRAKSSF